MGRCDGSGSGGVIYPLGGSAERLGLVARVVIALVSLAPLAALHALVIVRARVCAEPVVGVVGDLPDLSPIVLECDRTQPSDLVGVPAVEPTNPRQLLRGETALRGELLDKARGECCVVALNGGNPSQLFVKRCERRVSPRFGDICPVAVGDPSAPVANLACFGGQVVGDFPRTLVGGGGGHGQSPFSWTRQEYETAQQISELSTDDSPRCAAAKEPRAIEGANEAIMFSDRFIQTDRRETRYGTRNRNK